MRSPRDVAWRPGSTMDADVVEIVAQRATRMVAVKERILIFACLYMKDKLS